MGAVSGWNLWVWLPCIGVVSGCCCKELYRYSGVGTMGAPGAGAPYVCASRDV